MEDVFQTPGFAAAHDDAWALRASETTTLIGLWPGAQPAMTDVLDALRRRLGARIRLLDEPEADDEAILWAALIEVPGCVSPVLVWCEPAATLDAGELDDPRAKACQWIIGTQFLLDPDWRPDRPSPHGRPI